MGSTRLNLALEEKRFQRRSVHVYKCLNGLINNEQTLVTQQQQHNFNTRNKVNLRLPSVKRNWDQTKNCISCYKWLWRTFDEGSFSSSTFFCSSADNLGWVMDITRWCHCPLVRAGTLIVRSFRTTSGKLLPLWFFVHLKKKKKKNNKVSVYP